MIGRKSAVIGGGNRRRRRAVMSFVGGKMGVWRFWLREVRCWLPPCRQGSGKQGDSRRQRTSACGKKRNCRRQTPPMPPHPPNSCAENCSIESLGVWQSSQMGHSSPHLIIEQKFKMVKVFLDRIVIYEAAV